MDNVVAYPSGAKSGLRPLQSCSAADAIILGLLRVAYYLEPGAKILDFGCGSGGLVYEFRDLGFDAYGFDIHDYLTLRAPGDRRFFSIAGAAASIDSANMTVSAETFRIPFEDDAFDLVFSTQVFEHVQDLSGTLREIARVTAPSGIGVHLFPTRRNLIEPHIYVPFSTYITRWWWFYLWASLGIRNEFQGTFNARLTADENLRYSKIGLFHRPNRELVRASLQHFERATFVTRRYHSSRWRDDFLQYRRALQGDHPWRQLAATPKSRVLLMTGKQ